MKKIKWDNFLETFYQELIAEKWKVFYCQKCDYIYLSGEPKCKYCVCLGEL